MNETPEQYKFQVTENNRETPEWSTCYFRYLFLFKLKKETLNIRKINKN